MNKRLFFIISMMCMALLFLTSANAEEYTIRDYEFNWHVAKAGDVKMDVQKNSEGVAILLSSPGGRLARLAMLPSQAVAVGDVLKETEAYYDEQMKKRDPNMEKQVPAGDYSVTFSSSRGKNFQVSVRKSAAGALVAMDKDQALNMGKYLRDAEKLATVVNGRIRP